MKVTLYPPKAAVLDKLKAELTEVQCHIERDEDTLHDAEKRKEESVIHNPYIDTELDNARHRLNMSQMNEAGLLDRISLIEAAEDDTVEVSFETDW